MYWGKFGSMVIKDDALLNDIRLLESFMDREAPIYMAMRDKVA